MISLPTGMETIIKAGNFTSSLNMMNYVVTFTEKTGSNTIQCSSLNINRLKEADASRCQIEIPSVSPTDPSDLGYYNPYRGTSNPLVADKWGYYSNEWRLQILNSKSIKVEQGYGSTYKTTIFMGTIDDVIINSKPGNCSIRIDCRDDGKKLVDRMITSIDNGLKINQIEYPVPLTTTIAWLAAKETTTTHTKGSNRVTGTYILQHPASWYGNFTFRIWKNDDLTFTLYDTKNFTSAEYIAIYGDVTTAPYTFTVATADVDASFYTEFFAYYGGTWYPHQPGFGPGFSDKPPAVEDVIKDLCVRAGFLAANVHIVDLSGLCCDTIFINTRYIDAINSLLDMIGFELFISEINELYIRFPTGNQPRILAESHTLTGTNVYNLAKTNLLINSYIVTNTSVTKTYTNYVDYEIDFELGLIQRTPASTISSGDTVLVSYTYAAWVFREGIDIFSIPLNLSSRDLFGEIHVIGQNGPDPTEIGLWKISLTDDGEYYTAWDGMKIPMDKIDLHTNINLTTLAQCQASADRLGLDMLRKHIQCEFEAIPVPWLQVGDCIQVIEHVTGISEVYKITAINYSADGSGGRMTIKCYYYTYQSIPM